MGSRSDVVWIIHGRYLELAALIGFPQLGSLGKRTKIHIDGKVWHLDVGSSPLGAVVFPRVQELSGTKNTGNCLPEIWLISHHSFKRSIESRELLFILKGIEIGRDWSRLVRSQSMLLEHFSIEQFELAIFDLDPSVDNSLAPFEREKDWRIGNNLLDDYVEEEEDIKKVEQETPMGGKKLLLRKKNFVNEKAYEKLRNDIVKDRS
ncbi:hypothetical protein Syun_014586 [Stephania yunnanensis]|uniref:Uncharacterized protein n=1 Tax=Stephania yunnanensis TaxID=152371 RepID=A0AAP0JKQ3_9MAGN